MFTKMFITSVIRQKVRVPSTWSNTLGFRRSIVLCVHQLLLNTSGRDHVDAHVLELRLR